MRYCLKIYYIFILHVFLIFYKMTNKMIKTCYVLFLYYFKLFDTLSKKSRTGRQYRMRRARVWIRFKSPLTTDQDFVRCWSDWE